MASELRERLLSLIVERAYTPGEVTLASGRTSNFYIDGKLIEVSPEGAFLIGEVAWERIRDLDVNAVGGLAVGAVPMVTSIAISCWNHGKELDGFFVRDAAKSHGTRKTIEGVLPENARVLLVDDVITSGGSTLKAAEAVEERGGKVVRVLAIVDRDAGAAELFASKGYEYDAVFSKEDVLARV